MRPARSAALCAALVAALAGLAGCGSETTFSAQEAVDEVNRHGAGLELGEFLTTSEEGAEVYSVSFAEATAPQGGDHAHIGGTLVINDDGESALSEYERCERSASLICFRAANALIVFDDSAAAQDLEQLEDALRSMAAE